MPVRPPKSLLDGDFIVSLQGMSPSKVFKIIWHQNSEGEFIVKDPLLPTHPAADEEDLCDCEGLCSCGNFGNHTGVAIVFSNWEEACYVDRNRAIFNTSEKWSGTIGMENSTVH